MSRNYIKKRAEEHFIKGDYKSALANYGMILQNNPENKEAKICALLCDFAEENEFEAHAIFDYYFIIKKENNQQAEEIVEGLIETASNDMSQLAELLSLLNSSDYESLDGISYDEFKSIISKNDNFRELFENIIYSTKVIITNRYEMYQFLNILIKNRFYDIAINYIDSASNIFKNDKRLINLADKIRKLRRVEAKTKS